MNHTPELSEYLGPIPYGRDHIGTDFHRRAVQLSRVGMCIPHRPWFSEFRQVKLMFTLLKKHSSKRIANYLLYRRQQGKQACVDYSPVSLTIAPNNYCNLSCPQCPSFRFKPIPETVDVDLAKSLITDLSSSIIQVLLYRVGEPLVVEAGLQLADHARRYGVWSIMHSNLNMDDPELPNRIVESGLNNLVVSCDGATQGIYQRYRQGGDIARVFSNMRALAEAKKSHCSRFPWITAKFLVFQHNWHEMLSFREQAFASGANEVIFPPAYVANDEFTPGLGYRFDIDTLSWMPIPWQSKHGCRHLWSGMSFDSSGTLFPCDLGCLPGDELAEKAMLREPMACWNGIELTQNRRILSANGPGNQDELLGLCRRCMAAW